MRTAEIGASIAARAAVAVCVAPELAAVKEDVASARATAEKLHLFVRDVGPQGLVVDEMHLFYDLVSQADKARYHSCRAGPVLTHDASGRLAIGADQSVQAPRKAERGGGASLQLCDRRRLA